MAIPKNTRNLLAVAGVVFVFGVILKRQTVDAVLRINEGTPFEGTGVVGSLGNVTNRASGGFLSRAGSRIGLFFSDIFDRRSLDELTNSGVTDNPNFVGPPEA